MTADEQANRIEKIIPVLKVCIGINVFFALVAASQGDLIWMTCLGVGFADWVLILVGRKIVEKLHNGQL